MKRSAKYPMLVGAAVSVLFIFFQNATLYNPPVLPTSEPQYVVKQKVVESLVDQMSSETQITIEGLSEKELLCVDSPSKEDCLRPSSYGHSAENSYTQSLLGSEPVRICLIYDDSESPDCRILESGQDLLASGVSYREIPWYK